MAEDFDTRVGEVAALAEPVRLALYRFVVAQREPVTRDQAAEGVGVARHVAKFHLDRLVDDRLLDAHYERPGGRTGPGAGRPAKHYRRSAHEVGVSVPERRYDLAGDLLATAIDESARDDVPVSAKVAEVARRRGRALGGEMRERLGTRPTRAQRVEAACDCLAAYGYEPRPGRDGVELANCPFHALATGHTELVCGMNHELLAAAVDSLDDPGIEARLVPHEGRCCVVIRSR